MNEYHVPPKIAVIPRRITITLTETQVREVIRRLKFRQAHLPNLTDPVWKALENELDIDVEETPGL